MVINIHQLNNQFITTNFENAWKIGYLEKYHKGLFGYKFNEKFVVLTDIGLLYFDDQELIHPKIIIPIFGSDFKRVILFSSRWKITNIEGVIASR